MNNLTKLTDLTNQDTVQSIINITTLTIIKKQDDLVDFFRFMHEAKPNTLQGYNLHYNEDTDNIFLTDIPLYGGYYQQLDSEWAWVNRRVINDWIRGLRMRWA